MLATTNASAGKSRTLSGGPAAGAGEGRAAPVVNASCTARIETGCRQESQPFSWRLRS
jgi:hypothetical protein